jgi:DNA-binding PadR family transcriptional regulator
MHHHFRKLFGSSDSDFATPSGRFFAPGEIRLALLSLLSEHPSHGYELMVRLEERCGGTYKASAGAIYPTLQQLEDQQLVRPLSVDDKKVYELTFEGQQTIETHAEAIARIWQRAVAWSEWGEIRHPDAAEIIAPVLRLAKVAIKVVVKSRGDPVKINHVRTILETAREEIERLQRKNR